MRARTSAQVHRAGRLGRLRCEPPLTLRRVRADRPDTVALCLVGSAAGPLAGDDLGLELCLDADARATLTATGASIAQGRAAGTTGVTDAARVTCRATLPEHARLHADPGPLIVCTGARVDVAVALTLDATAHVEWHELVVLGRSTDPHPGQVGLRWDVVRGGRPVLRQHVDLSTHWAQRTAGHRVVATAFLAGPEIEARTVVHSSTSIAQKLDDTAVLLTVLGSSAAQVRNDLGRLRCEFQRGER